MTIHSLSIYSVSGWSTSSLDFNHQGFTVAHIICQPCTGTQDRACQTACPVDCIHDVGAGHLIIDPKGCVDCGACIEVCPVSAIFEERRVPTEWRPFIDINAQLAREMKTT